MKERAAVKEALWVRTALLLAVVVLVGVLSGVEAQDKSEKHRDREAQGLEGTSDFSERVLYQSLCLNHSLLHNTYPQCHSHVCT